MFGEQQRRGDMNRGRHHVIAALTHVHMVVRMHGTGQSARRERGNHLVGIHIAAGARTRLEYIQRKLLGMGATGNVQRD